MSVAPTPTVPALVPGTGRSCKPNRLVPSKRIKAWHRSSRAASSLKQYARLLATTSGDNKAIANRWLASKGVRP